MLRSLPDNAEPGNEFKDHKPLSMEISQFTTLFLTAITEGGDFTVDPSLLEAVNVLFLLQGTAGLGIVLSEGSERLKQEDFNIANTIKLLRQNDDFFYAAYAFACGISPKVIGNQGFVSFLIALNNEALYRKEEKKKREEYLNAQEKAQIELNALIKRFTITRDVLISLFENSKKTKKMNLFY